MPYEHKNIDLVLDALMTSPIGIYVVRNGVFVLCNSRFQEITGYAREELIGRPALDLVIPEDREIVREKAIRMLKKETRSAYRFRILDKENRMKWIMESVASITFDGQRAVLGNFMDITEGEQLRASFLNSPIGIYIVQDRKFIFTNKKFQDITELTEDELLGVYPLNVVFPEDRDQVRRRAVAMLKGERKSPYQFRVMNKIGEFRWITESVAPIQHRGRPAVLGYFMDSTDTMRIEELLKASGRPDA